MFDTNNTLHIGTLLQNAGLITQESLQKALKFQSQFTKMKLGEILVLQDKIKSKTISFFVYKWGDFIKKGYQFPLGYYLQQAFLLDEQQIKTILQEQKKNQLKFGEIAIAKGWIKQKTINFFLENLSANPTQLISLESLEQYNQDQLHLERKYNDYSLILTRTLAWTAGNSYLTRNICQIFADSDFNIAAGKEYRAVDQLVENNLLRNWSTSKLGNSIKTIKQSIDNNQKCDSFKIWQEYREIIFSDSRKYQETKEQDELLNLGLIANENSKLRVANMVFGQVFNQDFVVEQINQKHQQNNLAKVSNSNSNKSIEKKEYSSNTKFLQESERDRKVGESKHMTKTKNKNKLDTGNEESKISRKKSLMITSGVVLLIPLFLLAMNFLSPTKKANQFASPQNNNTNALEKESTNTVQRDDSSTLKQYCEGIDISDSSARLNNIFKLEQKKKEFLESNSNNSSAFPDICERVLNEERVLIVPELGKDNKTIDALRNLCNIPLESEFITEAKVWLDHWYHSPEWGKATKFYIQEAVSCPAGDKLLESSNHRNH